MRFREWKEVRLGDVLKLNYGKGLPERKRIFGNIPVYSSAGITGWHNKPLVRKEGIVVGRKGTVGSVYYSKQSFFCIDTAYYLTQDDTNQDLKYIYYLLKYLPLTKLNTDSAVPGLNRDNAYSQIISLPPLKEQKAIAHILSTLDEKIEVNNQINKKLEEMAQTIFKHWFVDFEFPCLPDGAGKPYDKKELYKACRYKEVGGLPGPDNNKCFVYVLLCEDESFYIGITDDLYRSWYEHKMGIDAKWTRVHEPIKVIHYEEYQSREEAEKREKDLKTDFGKKWIKREYEKLLNEDDASPSPKTKLRQAGEMVDSELGMIPNEWEVKTLDEIAIITMGQSPKGSSYNEHEEGTVFYQGRTDFSNRFPVRRLYTTEPKRMVKNGDILMSVRAPVGDINIANEECCIGRGLCSFKSKDNMDSFLLYLLLNLKEKFDVFNGEGTVFGSITQRDLKSTKTIMPNNSQIKDFNEIATSLDKQYLCLDKETRKLTNLRDTLLPKLMSGEIRVPLDSEVDVS